nr:PREDICTED: zinc finger protein 692 isoform X2 [Lepisosteus oculatus]
MHGLAQETQAIWLDTAVMSSTRDAARRQRRRELDARRSKSRIRLGSCLEDWGELKEKLGFGLHSELAQYLLESYFSNICISCSGAVIKMESLDTFLTSKESLNHLVTLVHNHSQQCHFTPIVQAAHSNSPNPHSNVVNKGRRQTGDLLNTLSAEPLEKCDAQLHKTIFDHIDSDHRKSPTRESNDTIGHVHGDCSCKDIVTCKRNDLTDKCGSVVPCSDGAYGTSEDCTENTSNNDSISCPPISGTGEAACRSRSRLAQGSPEMGGDTVTSGGDGRIRRSLGLRWECEGGHVFVWCPSERVDRAKKSNLGAREGAERVNSQSETLPALRKTRAKPSRRCRKDGERAKELSTNRTRRDPSSNSPTPDAEHEPAEEVTLEHRAAEDGNSATDKADSVSSWETAVESGSNLVAADNTQLEDASEEQDSPPVDEEADISYTDDLTDKNYSPFSKSDAAVSWMSTSPVRNVRYGNTVQTGEATGETRKSLREKNRRNIRRGTDDDISQIGAKRIRKATQREILPCEFDGCGKIFSTRQYLNHHMKYQHFQQKTFACSHPTCGKSFNFKKHLKEHEKLHSNKRDYICEFCARAFRTSSNLIIHRRIHTGEKPLQCEVCGFTCRQKASLNWHMRKHNAESSYLYACEICGKRFEKRDNVAAHRNKSHPQCPGPAPPPSCHPEPLADGTRAGAQPSPS